MASFVLSFFPLDVLDESWDLIESVSEGFLTYSFIGEQRRTKTCKDLEHRKLHYISEYQYIVPFVLQKLHFISISVFLIVKLCHLY